MLLIDIVNLQNLIVALGGGGISQAISALLFHFSSKKKAKIEEFELLVDQYKHLYEEGKMERDLYKQAEKNCEIKVNNVINELNRLKVQMIVLESAHQDLPFPQWFKDTDFRMLSCNSEFERAFLIPNGFSKEKYIGKRDEEIWGEKDGHDYAKSDRDCLNSKNGFIFYQESSILINGVQEATCWKIIKYVVYSGIRKVGIAGIAIPL